MGKNLNFILIFLIGCNGAAENNAVRWTHKIYPAEPIYSVSCSEDENKAGLVDCVVAVEAVGRLFNHKLKCYNRKVIFPASKVCEEVFDG